MHPLGERLGFRLATPFLGGFGDSRLWAMTVYDQSSVLLRVTDDRLAFRRTKSCPKGADDSM